MGTTLPLTGNDWRSGARAHGQPEGAPKTTGPPFPGASPTGWSGASSIPAGGDPAHTAGEQEKGAKMATALQRPVRGQGRVIAGVCAAVADRFGISRTAVRVGFVIFGLVGAGEVVYIALWVLVPSADR
jgi:phage shock protein C